MKISINLDKKFFLRIGLAIFIIGIFIAGIIIGFKIRPSSYKEESLPTYEQEEEVEYKPSPKTSYLKEYTFSSEDNSGNISYFSFKYSPELNLIEPNAISGIRAVKLKPQGEEVEDSYYIGVDEPPKGLGEGIRIDKKGRPVKFGSNRYTEHDVFYDPENRLVMMIYDPKPLLKLGNIYVSWWDKTRKQEALDHAEIIMETLREIGK